MGNLIESVAFFDCFVIATPYLCWYNDINRREETTFAGQCAAKVDTGINLFSCGKERLAGKSSTDDTGYCYGDCRSFIRRKVWHMYNRNNHYLRTGYSVYGIKNEKII